MNRLEITGRAKASAGRRLTRSIALAALFVPTAQAADLRAQDCEDVSGVWAVELNLPGAAPQQVTLTLEQSDCDATGLVEGNNRTPIDDGKVEGSTVSFSTTVTNQADGQSLVIAWEASVDGDDISGTLSAQMLGTVEFTGTRVEG